MREYRKLDWEEEEEEQRNLVRAEKLRADEGRAAGSCRGDVQISHSSLARKH